MDKPADNISHNWMITLTFQSLLHKKHTERV